jgi:hypothetical protein
MGYLTVTCKCGQQMKVPASALGKTGTCVDCGQRLRIAKKNTSPCEQEPQAPPPPPSSAPPEACPKCRVRWDSDAVICMNCGFNSRTGRLLGAAGAAKSNSAKFLWAGRGFLIGLGGLLLVGIPAGGLWGRMFPNADKVAEYERYAPGRKHVISFEAPSGIGGLRRGKVSCQQLVPGGRTQSYRYTDRWGEKLGLQLESGGPVTRPLTFTFAVPDTESSEVEYRISWNLTCPRAAPFDPRRGIDPMKHFVNASVNGSEVVSKPVYHGSKPSLWARKGPYLFVVSLTGLGILMAVSAFGLVYRGLLRLETITRIFDA